MSKRKNNRKKLPDDHSTYQPRLNTEEQAANHRKASAGYYKRNIAEIREKRRIQVAERRAAAKLRKRRWDPPKRSKRAEDPISTDPHGSGLESLVVDELSRSEVFTAPSSTRANLITFSHLDMNEASSDGSSFAAVEQEKNVSSMSVAERPNNIRRPESPTPDERIAVEALASMALFQAEPLLQNNNSTDSALSLAAMLSSFSNSSNVGGWRTQARR
ncbi:hypothetical protein C8J57DRAFT_459014 [Mycena rebaudengoi]|nr:hypothetical protein C8J57DRAFT_459014 [Mycena rebaudengoi]